MGREFALLGDPVEHSLSPTIHAAAFRAWRTDDRYVLRRVGHSDVEDTLRVAAGRGGGNVTLPHKATVAALLDRPSAAVRATGACNCFWPVAEGIAGDNTDVGGFLQALGEDARVLGGGRVLVLGAGGAARAVVFALGSLGVARVEVWNRTVERAEALASTAPHVRALREPPVGEAFDLVVNATRLGLEEADGLPLDLSEIATTRVFDLVYRAGATTGWVRHARDRGVAARDGLEMLVHQAALSLSRWFPDREPPLEAMFASLEGRG